MLRNHLKEVGGVDYPLGAWSVNDMIAATLAFHRKVS
jgi:hypothetical protein